MSTLKSITWHFDTGDVDTPAPVPPTAPATPPPAPIAMPQLPAWANLPTPTPTHIVRVGSDGDLKSLPDSYTLPTDTALLFNRGETFRVGSIHVGGTNCIIGDYGDTTKPKPVLASTYTRTVGQAIIDLGGSHVEVRNICFDALNTDAAADAISLHASGCQILGCETTAFRLRNFIVVGEAYPANQNVAHDNLVRGVKWYGCYVQKHTTGFVWMKNQVLGTIDQHCIRVDGVDVYITKNLHRAHAKVDPATGELKKEVSAMTLHGSHNLFAWDNDIEADPLPLLPCGAGVGPLESEATQVCDNAQIIGNRFKGIDTFHLYAGATNLVVIGNTFMPTAGRGCVGVVSVSGKSPPTGTVSGNTGPVGGFTIGGDVSKLVVAGNH